MISQRLEIAYPKNLHNVLGKTVLVVFCLFFARLAVADSALFDAAKVGDTVKLEQVLTAGADLNARDDNGYTALMWAARKGRLEAVRYLNEQGADLAVLSRSGFSACKLATNFGHYGVADYLERQPASLESRKRLRRAQKNRYYLVFLDDCPGQIDVMKLTRDILLKRRWHHIERVDKTTIDATLDSKGTGYRVRIKYNPANHQMLLEYPGQPYGRHKWLIKTAKIIRKNLKRRCPEQEQNEGMGQTYDDEDT